MGEELRSVLRRQRRPTHTTAAIGGLWSGIGILSLMALELFFPRAMTSWMQWLTFAVVFWFAPIWLLAGPIGRPPYQFPLSKRESRTRRRRAQQRFLYLGALFMTIALGTLLAMLYSQFQ